MSLKRKRGYSRWTEDEETALRVGVSRYGEGKWKRILCDSELSKYFVDRSNVDLKDKWRTLLCAEKTRPGSSPCTSDDTTMREPYEHCTAGMETKKSVGPSSKDNSSERAVPERSSPASSCSQRAASDAEKALISALNAAKRRHQGTTGPRATLLLQSELMLEVWKALNGHEAAGLLRHVQQIKGSNASSEVVGLSGLRRRVSLTSSCEPCTCAEFFASVIALIRSAQTVQGLDPSEELQLVKFEKFARRQFEVLCRADEGIAQSMKLCTDTLSTKESKCLEDVHPDPEEPGTASKSSKRTKATKPKNGKAVSEDLFAADVLQMIRGSSPCCAGTSSVNDEGSTASLHGRDDAGISTCQPTLPEPLPTGAATAAQPPRGAHVFVPPGCGLVPTAVSAAMDKASELLNNSGTELLPVKDLINADEMPAPVLPVLSLDRGAQAAALPTLPGTQTVAVSSASSALPMFGSCAGTLRGSELPVGVQLGGAVGGLHPRKMPHLLMPAVPAGAEGWYPAYMAWVYSSMAHTGSCS